MPEAMITYMTQPAKVRCDGNCKKAWGINARPSIQLSDDPDDFEYMSDGELGEAPADSGMYEGGHAKPGSQDEFPNKWCVRECERCGMSATGKHGEPLELKSFDVRRINKP